MKVDFIEKIKELDEKLKKEQVKLAETVRKKWSCLFLLLLGFVFGSADWNPRDTLWTDGFFEINY